MKNGKLNGLIVNGKQYDLGVSNAYAQAINDFQTDFEIDNKKTYLARYIAQIIKEKISTESINFDYILFVPIHKKRLKERGFKKRS